MIINQVNHRLRIEKDFLGSKEIPYDAYYGIQTLRAVENLCLQNDVLTAEELDSILNPYEMTEPGIAAAFLFDRD
jgi:aspartate ammonia-lyase